MSIIRKKLKNTNTWRSDNMILNNQQVTEKNQEGNKKYSGN